MTPARTSRRAREDTRLLVLGPESGISHQRVADLPTLLAPGDLLVLNRSGTLPSSFRTADDLELRLASFRGRDPSDLSRWMAVVFGAGDWRQATESRALPRTLRAGERLDLGGGLEARVRRVDLGDPRLIEVELAATDLIPALYRQGRPIQYSYLESELEVWDQQTAFSGPPLSVEPPSAGFALTWRQLLELRRRGVELSTVLHAAGLSSTGDPSLDRRFPLAEYFEVPARTRALAEAARARGNRVVAWGTTAARALESCFTGPTQGYTGLRLGPGHRLRLATTLVTGMHEAGTSHAELMEAFAPRALLEQGAREARGQGYHSHEYGDLTWVESGLQRITIDSSARMYSGSK